MRAQLASVAIVVVLAFCAVAPAKAAYPNCAEFNSSTCPTATCTNSAPQGTCKWKVCREYPAANCSWVPGCATYWIDSINSRCDSTTCGNFVGNETLCMWNGCQVGVNSTCWPANCSSFTAANCPNTRCMAEGSACLKRPCSWYLQMSNCKENPECWWNASSSMCANVATATPSPAPFTTPAPTSTGSSGWTPCGNFNASNCPTAYCSAIPMDTGYVCVWKNCREFNVSSSCTQNPNCVIVQTPNVAAGWYCEPRTCTSYNTSTACDVARCRWDLGRNTCNPVNCSNYTVYTCPPDHCDRVTTQPLGCKPHGCAWYWMDGSCNNDPSCVWRPTVKQCGTICPLIATQAECMNNAFCSWNTASNTCANANTNTSAPTPTGTGPVPTGTNAPGWQPCNTYNSSNCPTWCSIVQSATAVTCMWKACREYSVGDCWRVPYCGVNQLVTGAVCDAMSCNGFSNNASACMATKCMYNDINGNCTRPNCTAYTSADCPMNR
jgi:hypothetical protein